MGILAAALRRTEQRSSLENPKTSLSSVNWPGDGVRTAAGVSVTEEKALALSAVWRAVRLCTQDIASMPFLLYERQKRGKERAPNNPLYRVLHDRPNPEMSSFTYWETVQGHIELWGNHYSEIERNGAGQVKALWPLMPDRTHPERKDGVKSYVTTLPGGVQVRIPANRIMHVPGFGFDGLVGKSPITMARESLGAVMAVREYGARYFGNGARTSGVLTHPEHVGPEALKSIKDSWQDLHEGLSNSHRIAVLEEGVTYQQISISPEDSQFLETQRFGVQEVARWFGVPLHMLNDNSMSPASNVEQASLDWVMHGIRPRSIRIEKAVNWDLVPQGSLLAEFLLASLLRGDNASRSQFYREMFNIGVMSQNDIREAENMNAIEGGDTYFVPLNMVPVEMAINPPEPKPASALPEPESEEDERTRRLSEIGQRAGRVCAPLFADAVARGLNRELLAAKRAREKSVKEWMDSFYPKHRDYLAGQLTPVLTAFGEAVRDLSGADLNVADLVSRMAREAAKGWVDDSIGQLETAMDAANPTAAVDECLDRWEADRVGELARTCLAGAHARFIPEILRAGRFLPAAA